MNQSYLKQMKIDWQCVLLVQVIIYNNSIALRMYVIMLIDF
jgi:hypothetical protein